MELWISKLQAETKISLRPGTVKDAPDCGRICYEAFKEISEQHGFPVDLPSAETATRVLSLMLSSPKFYSVVAEKNGKIVGSNFMDERTSIAGIGPLSVDPAEQDGGVGRLMMEDALLEVDRAKFAGVRLLQSAYHVRSLSLYTKLGFVTRETLSVLQGRPISHAFPGISVRQATDADLDQCNELCLSVHGFDRGGELADSIENGDVAVAEREGRVRGYASGPGFFGHSVALTNDDLMAMLASGREYEGPGIIVPSRNHRLFRWCLTEGLRIVEQMTLMTMGMYNEPAGAYLPSVLY
jgi:predicted N-acetyltransferase YhbS